MRDVAILFVHLIVTVVRLAGPGGNSWYAQGIGVFSEPGALAIFAVSVSEFCVERVTLQADSTQL